MADETDRKPQRRAVLLLAAVLLVLVAAMIWRQGLMIGGTGIAMCSIETQNTITSPDSKHQLVVFTSDCGDDRSSADVSITPKDVAFVPDKYPPSFGISPRADLAVKWISASEVEIVVPEGKVFHQETTGPDGITLTYR